MTARETLAIVYAIEALRLETRALVASRDAVAEVRRLADDSSVNAFGLGRQAVEAELPPENRRERESGS